MARKQAIAIQDHVDTTDDFLEYITEHKDTLICMEVYSEYCGQCVPMLANIRKIKMEYGTDRISMAKACSDEIEPLERFKFKSEPVYIFISKGDVTRVMFGADGIRLNDLVVEELAFEEKEASSDFKRPRFTFLDHTPEEEQRAEAEVERRKLVQEERKRVADARQAARKQRVCERLAVQVPILNYIMFFPHCHKAHYELYEKWDALGLSVLGKEEWQLTEEDIGEAFYQSDVDLNEACVHELLTQPVLIILFKGMDSMDADIIQIMRHVLYEEIPELDPELSPAEQKPQITAYEVYGTISKPREQVVRERWDQEQALKKAQREDRIRLREESKRLADEAEAERVAMEKKRAEEEKFARLQAGATGGAPEPEPEPETKPEQAEEEEGAVDEEKPEEEDEQEVGSDQEPEFDYETVNDEEEYIPPGGLFIPGFYSPPNHLARANGITLFFPKLTEKFAQLESEFLPPHLLLLFPIDKRHEVHEVMKDFKDEILQVGIFSGSLPQKPKFVAYSVKQYDKTFTLPDPEECLAVMVARKRSLPLLTLAGLGPVHISIDLVQGEKECAELFPVGYGDEFEEEVTIVEEEEEEIEGENA